MLPAGIVDQLLVAGVLVAVAALGIVVLRHAPRAAIGAWLASVCLVPVWIGVGLGFGGNLFIPAAAAVAVLAVITLIPVRGFRPSAVDGLFALLLVVNVVSFATGQASIALTSLVTTVVYFATGYALGRSVTSRVDVTWLYGAIGIALTVVAVIAIVQFVTGFTPYPALHASNSLYSQWAPLQQRGGVTRAEAGFGHSIALGSSVAIGIPLTLASRLPAPTRVVMTLLLLGGSVVSLSRVGMIGAALGLILTAAFLRGALSLRTRVFLGALILVAGVAVFPPVSTVFQDAGDEAVGSSDYRGDLLSLVPRMAAIGVSSSATRSPTGELCFGPFRSIDSQLVLTGLTGGILPLLAVLIAIGAAVVLVITGRATAPTIAVVAQLPAVATAALITQWSILFCFIVGLAVTTQLTRHRHLAFAQRTLAARGSDTFSSPAPRLDLPLPSPSRSVPSLPNASPQP